MTESFKKEERLTIERGNQSWAGGAILIGIGLVFLLSNVTDFRLDNWWALFILIPVVGMWSQALRSYRAFGRMTEEARSALLSSLFPLFVASIFLFNWDWGQVWPGFIIIAGINALGRRD